MKISDVKPGDVIVKDYDGLRFYYVVRKVHPYSVECVSMGINPRNFQLYCVNTTALLDPLGPNSVVLSYKTAVEALCTGE